ncbi:MAG: branched-chain amino acid ABC transporter permease [Hyphomicrobiales bacterium]|nr:branched-chain amino acid ABC transporter permease [Hyphomicrobiales bacterium]PCH51528.1 MAG: branched-chain amino acid ABC transporter permease [Hyphomicrobiales bacterium]
MDILNSLVLLANYIFVPGLTYGCQLALGALGITLVYGILRFSNFAHGETMSFGAMFSILFMWLFQSWGISIAPLPTVLIALPFGILCTIAWVLFCDKAIYKFYRTKKAPPVIFLIASTGLMFLMAGVIRFIIGPRDQTVSDGARFIMRAREFKEMTGLDEGLAIKTSQAITVIATIIIVTLLFWFLNKTLTGKSMRAYSDNEDLALLSGINPDRVVMYAWVITAIIATVAGTLYGLDKSYKPFTFLQLLLPIFAAAIVGGIGNPLGAVVGGFVIAFSEITVTYAYKKFYAYLTPESWHSDGLLQLLSTDYKFAVSFVILVVVLLIKPTGIFKGQSL